jgi:hypothetical protein
MPFTKPSTGTVLTRENERNEGSSAQRRIWPSHEPEAKRSVPRSAASEVIHRAPDSCCSSEVRDCVPCAKETEKIGFFLPVCQSAMVLRPRQRCGPVRTRLRLTRCLLPRQSAGHLACTHNRSTPR